MDKQGKTSSEPLMHDLTRQSSLQPITVVSLLIVVVLFGVGTGYILAKNTSSSAPTTSGIKINSSTVKKGVVFGSNDTKNYKDNAEGILKPGGIEGEGEYHLERSGGSSQYVYLTSSLVDLSQLLNKKIKVWGQTQKAEKAGWLMDVGRVEVLE
jgi:hypothetical protein